MSDAEKLTQIGRLADEWKQQAKKLDELMERNIESDTMVALYTMYALHAEEIRKILDG